MVFNGLAENRIDFCPVFCLKAIDKLNAFIGDRINIGVYRVGFAPNQETYDEAVKDLFAALDEKGDLGRIHAPMATEAREV